MKIDVFIDLSEENSEFLQSLAHWTGPEDGPKAEVRLIHSLHSMVPPGTPLEARASIIAEQKSRLGGELEALARHRLQGNAHIRVAEKPVADVLKEYPPSAPTSSLTPDLIAFGLKRKGRVEGFILGSTAEEIVDHIDRPALGLPMESVCPVSPVWLVALHPDFPLNKEALDGVLCMYGDQIQELRLISVVSEKQDLNQVRDHLTSIGNELPFRSSVVCVRNATVKKELMRFSEEHPKSPVMMQRRRHTWKEELRGPGISRTLLFKAEHPIIMLPLRIDD